ncbi:ABC transporter ATP-binding protein [Gracilibacillus phocaeensis]|uniref:ABC transporter ATP-binding protein n=1 Tax=Gracilibacillus phocaeensis TaxID=2042304 RepID=UPI00102F521C|nr:ABC transporter ATP-binding protein [Gracilibacillus phocaeensis]
MFIDSVTKKYHGSAVLKDLSFDFKQGEIIGLIGSNGAGKSTLMKIITQTIPTYDGSVEGNHQVGYLIEEPKLFQHKTGLAHLVYFSKIFGHTFQLSEFEQLLKNLQLYDVLHKKVKQYSLGMRQKLAIVISLLNKPSYVVLDEPTNSMDIETSLEVLQQLKKMAHEWQVGILISSHKLEDIETICDRVLFLEKGTIFEDQRFNRGDQYRLKLVFKHPADVAIFSDHQELGTIIYSSERTIEMETTAENAEVFRLVNQLGIQLIDFTAEEKTLRHVYMDKFRGEHHDI